MLKPLKLKPLTSKNIKPQGWLGRQLQIQANGLCGVLDKIWPDIRDSSWIGGDKDGWERVPYWLDGFIPLAWLLGDEDLQNRASRYIDGILAGQEEDGWICPCPNNRRNRYDVWAVFLICKVLVVYHDCTGDSRIQGAVEKALLQLYRHISVITLFNWGHHRWFECLIPIFWLYERTGDERLLKLAGLLEAQGMDYEKLAKQITDAPKEKRYWTYQNHVVNIAMSLKSRALMSRLTGENPNVFCEEFLSLLLEKHGMAIEHFSGDECLGGTDSNRGTELCGIVEAMYSYEWLLSIDGGITWGDKLEKLAYNALPAAFTPDMNAHQYVQLTNQIQCTPLEDKYNPFNSNNGEAHIFGLEPHFGCCTANFNQGWPKFALSAVMRNEHGFTITAIAPVFVKDKIDGIDVAFTVETEYPFRDEYTVIIETAKPCKLDIELRIPGFYDSAFVDGEPVTVGQYKKISRIFSGRTELKVQLITEAKYINRPDNTACIWRGALLYSLPIKAEIKQVEYIRDGVERKFPWCDYHITPTENWGYAYCNEQIKTEYNIIGAIPFSPEEPPLKLKTNAVAIKWENENGICKMNPELPKNFNQKNEINLIPYGCTLLRVTQLPVLSDIE